MPNMDVAVSIWRTIVQDEQGPLSSMFLNPPIQIAVFPLLQHLRLTISQVGLHRECRIWQVNCVFVIHTFLCCVDISFCLAQANLWPDAHLRAFVLQGHLYLQNLFHHGAF